MRRGLRSPATAAALVALLAAVAGAASPGAAPAAAPRVLFLDVESGPVSGGPGGLGVPITISGRGFGRSGDRVTVTIGGVPVARVLGRARSRRNPSLTTIVVQPGPRVRGGPVQVELAGRRSQPGPRFEARSGRFLAVATSGSDGGPCTLGRPCASIQHAVAQMRPGDLLLVRGGRYQESEIWIRGELGQSGEPGRPKVIKAFPGERVVLANGERPFIVDASWITVAGLEFEDGKSLGVPDVGLPGHRGNRFLDNAFSGLLGYSAIDLHGDAHEVAGNTCRATGSSVGTQGHCIYVSYGRGSAVRFNVAGGAPGYGIHVFDEQRTASDFQRVISDLVIEGNVLHGSRERSGLILAMGDEGGLGNRIENVLVHGNTFTRNNHLGMAIGPNTRRVQVTGNRFLDNGRQGLAVADDATIEDVTVVGNRFRQAANDVCRIDCSWYRLAHVDVGQRARDVRVGRNRYGPGPAVLLGA